MNSSSGVIIYGKKNYDFNIIYSERNTLEISVNPDFSIVVRAPVECDYDKIQTLVTKRSGWIKKQINYFEQFYPRTTERIYAGGETHLYLGKKYRLKISTNDINEIKLTGGFFKASVNDCRDSGKIKQLLDEWYRDKSIIIFQEILDKSWSSFEKIPYKKPSLKIRQMKKRWGSLSSKGNLTLNLSLIHTPKECIEYVITHELCHLKYKNHGKEFIRFLTKALPDWEKRKNKLELTIS